MTGYRHYTIEQIADAHVVRRLRDLDMPIDEVRSVLHTTDAAARHAIIAAHLAAMEQRLRATTDAVASLRELLTAPVDVLDLRYRTVAPTPVWSISADVGQHEIREWASRSLRRLVGAVGAGHRTGPPGVLYEPPFFEEGRGRVVAFVPTARRDVPPAPVDAAELPAADLAIGLHRGRLRRPRPLVRRHRPRRHRAGHRDRRADPRALPRARPARRRPPRPARRGGLAGRPRRA